MNITRFAIKPQKGKELIGRDWTPEDFLKAFEEVGYKGTGFFGSFFLLKESWIN